MVFGNLERRNGFLVEHHYILYKSRFCIASPVRSDHGWVSASRNPWKSRARIRATIARPVGYGISGRSPGIFVARRENRSSGTGERWHHSSMRDQGRRRPCRTLLSKDLLSARSSAYALNTREVLYLRFFNNFSKRRGLALNAWWSIAVDSSLVLNSHYKSLPRMSKLLIPRNKLKCRRTSRCTVLLSTRQVIL